MQTLEQKVQQAENIAESMLQEHKSSAGGAKRRENTLELREKIFSICQMLYDEQKATGT